MNLNLDLNLILWIGIKIDVLNHQPNRQYDLNDNNNFDYIAMIYLILEQETSCNDIYQMHYDNKECTNPCTFFKLYKYKRDYFYACVEE